MLTYAKLFSRILDSTIWCEDDQTRLLWITMLALADKNGVVQCTIPGLANRAKISLEQCERALEKFQQPDKYSWSTEEDGRRIRVVGGGWALINHAKYRAMMSKEERRLNNAVYQQAHRDRVADSKQTSAPRKTLSALSAHTDTDVDTDTKALKSSAVALRAPRKQLTVCPEDFSPNETNIKNATKMGLDLGACVEAFKDFHLSKGNRFADWNLALNTWLRNQVGFERKGRSSGIPADFKPRDFRKEAIENSQDEYMTRHHGPNWKEKVAGGKSN